MADLKNIVLDIAREQTEIERRQRRVSILLREGLSPALKKLLEKKTGGVAYISYPEKDVIGVKLEFAEVPKEKVIKAIEAVNSIRNEIIANSHLEVEPRLYCNDYQIVWKFESNGSEDRTQTARMSIKKEIKHE